MYCKYGPLVKENIGGKIIVHVFDPEDIKNDFQYKVDMIIDGGVGGNIPSTLVDCSADEIIILRQGLGVWTD